MPLVLKPRVELDEEAPADVWLVQEHGHRPVSFVCDVAVVRRDAFLGAQSRAVHTHDAEDIRVIQGDL